MHKVRLAMKSSESYPCKDHVFVDEFVFGGSEDLKQGRSTDAKKKKIVIALELNEQRGVKRAYFKSIDNYSSRELILFKGAEQNICEPHIRKRKSNN